MANIKYPWIANLEATLQDEGGPNFEIIDLSKLSKKLSEHFSLDLSFEMKNAKWLTTDQALSSLSMLHNISFTVNPMSGNCFVLISDQDLALMTKTLLKHDSCPEAIKKEFLYYLILESILAIKESGTGKNLNIAIDIESNKIPQESVFIKDIIFKVADIDVMFKIAFPQSFYRSFQSHIKQVIPSIIKQKPLNSCSMKLGLEIARINLTPDELKHLSIGDWIICDNIGYDPKSKQGTGAIVLKDMTIMKAKIDKESFSTTEA